MQILNYLAVLGGSEAYHRDLIKLKIVNYVIISGSRSLSRLVSTGTLGSLKLLLLL